MALELESHFSEDVENPLSFGLSHTRGVPLEHLSVFCYVLGESIVGSRLRTLVTQVQAKIRLTTKEFGAGDRLPTRINHHIIALRELGLAYSVTRSHAPVYQLTQLGTEMYEAMKRNYSGTGAPDMELLRPIWRRIFCASEYVRREWINHFMLHSEVVSSPEAFQSTDGYVVLSRHDGELYLETASEKTFAIGEIGRQEIYEGLREWTNAAYMTDDRLPPDRSIPFSYYRSGNRKEWDLESHPVKAWISPSNGSDLLLFKSQFDVILEKYGGRVMIPVLLRELCELYGYSKFNIKELIQRLYDDFSRDYFFERGSEFLIREAFASPSTRTNLDFYLQLDGVWRVGVVRY